MKSQFFRGTNFLLFAAALTFGQLCIGQTQQPKITLDTDFPSAQSGPFMGIASFSGWAVDSANSITGFTASVDGVPLDSVTYGVFRGDVCVTFNGPSCPNVGWALTLDTTELSTGNHTFSISASSASGDYATQSTPFVVANWSAPSANPMKISIDSPSPQSAAFNGMAMFSGWAIDSSVPIASVSIAVDGVEYGNAFYGAYRADVCKVYQNTPGCPEVGWAFQFDTTSVADGTHTLAVTSTSSTGEHYTTTVQFKVANSGPKNPIKINVDSPNSQSHPFSGVASFGGWALDDTSAISAITLSVDGLAQGDAIMGIYRADVCSVFPGRSGCPNVGWSFNLDTSVLAQGSHSLELTAHAADGRQSTVTVPFSVGSSTGISPAAVGSVKVSIAQPSVSGSTLTGAYVFSGAALDDTAAIASVRVSVDGTTYPANYGLQDVAACTYDSGAPNCPNAGWSLAVDTNQLSNGNHTLSVLATAANGQHAAVGTSFTVSNWTTANPMTLDIDAPNSNSHSFSGSVTFSGWAVDSQAALSSVAILVDGVNYGFAVYGDYRQDVCKVYSGSPGCPSVGWHVSLDTTQLSSGSHKLTIIGATGGGEHSTLSAPFTVSNPTHLSIDNPNAQSQPFSGTASFGGWAINDNAAVTTVEVFVDGIPYSNASYGIYRADVCAAYPKRAGCPNVGWGFQLDTTTLVAGIHTLQIIAVAGNGQQGSLTASFSVAQQGTPIQLGQQGAGRILDEATWGPTPASLQVLQAEGFDKWFQDQVAAPISTYPDQPNLNPDGSINDNQAPVTLQFFENALNGPDQLRQRVAFALSEIWVVSALQIGNAPAFPPLLRIFQNRAFDNYENLMNDVTLNPAMGAYLNMVNNAKANAAQGTAANENYARELMQLMTIGLTTLNMDGSPVLDANGSPVPTYAMTDVTNLARALTGWTYAPVPGAASHWTNPSYFLAPMVAFETEHDETAKQFLGTTLPAGNTASEDLAAALHTIFLQPSLPPFISKQLIQHLVTSSPSPEYVARVAAVFANNGQGTRGDLSAVVYAILTDPEARAGDTSTSSQTNFGHLREPVLYVANLARGLNATLSSTSTIAVITSSIGQPLFKPPSVFSYFSPSFTTTTGLLAPEFAIYSTQAAAEYVDSTYAALYNNSWTTGTTVNLSPFIAAASNSDSLIDLLNAEFLHESMSTNLRNAVYVALAPLTAPADKAKAALYTVLTSSEYLVIH